MCLLGPTPALADVDVGAYLGAQVYDAQRDLSGEDQVVEPLAAPLVGVRATLSVPWLLVDLEADLGFLYGFFDDDSTFQAVQARVEVRYDFLDGELQPFVSLGPTVLVALTDDFGTDADLGASGGGGLSWAFSETLSIRTDVRWLLADGVEGAANDWEFTVGAGFPL